MASETMRRASQPVSYERAAPFAPVVENQSLSQAPDSFPKTVVAAPSTLGRECDGFLPEEIVHFSLNGRESE